MADHPMLHAKLGARLRELRQARKLSVRTLAARSGFSPSFISNIESETVSPSIASLEKIAHALGVTLSELFSSIESPPRLIVRAHERATYQSEWSKSVASVLTDSGRGRDLSLVEVVIAPDGASGSRAAPLTHDLVALTLSGAVELSVDEGIHILGAGDAAYLRRGMGVVWRNRSGAHATLLLISITTQTDQMVELFMDATDTSHPDQGHPDQEAP